MMWIFLSVGAIFLWSFVNIFDQYLVRKYSVGDKGSGGLVLFSSLIGIFIAIFISIFVHGIFYVPLIDKVLLIITGGLSISWIILYLRVIEVEDISYVAPWFSIVPVFGYIFAYIFLGETFTLKQIIGSIIILIGVIIISIDLSSSKKYTLKLKSSFLMLLACFIIAIMGVIFKYVTIGDNFWISSFWEYFGLGMFGILIYILVPGYRREFTYMNKTGGMKIFILNTFSEILTIFGNLFTNYAILLAPIAMVYLVESFQPAIVLLLVILGTYFYPKVISEKMSSKVLVGKIIALVVMAIGSLFLFI